MSCPAIQEPVYYHRDYAQDLPQETQEGTLWHTSKRVAIAALPFLTLYKPLSFPLSLVLGGLRSLASLTQWIVAFKQKNLSEMTYESLQTALALIALTGTLFAHPLGMLITTVHDCALDALHIGQALYAGHYMQALGHYTYLMNNALYLALFLSASLEVIVASLALQTIVALGHSFLEAKKGNSIEATGHFFMGLIRGNQFLTQNQLLQWEIMMSGTTPSTSGNIFHRMALYLQMPVQWTSELFLRAYLTPIRPGIEGNFSSPLIERTSRFVSMTFTVLAAPFTISLYAIGEGFHYLGNTINKTPYTYWKGNASEKLDSGEVTNLDLNACMLWGGLPIPLGGLRPPKERIEALAQLILENNPDNIFLQEMSFPAAALLWDKLKDHYAHCYTRISPNPFRMESGLTVMTKLHIDKVHVAPFPNQNGILRSAFFMETTSYCFATTHLESGSNNQQMRKDQLDIITKKMDEIKKEKERTCILLGDLNINFKSKKRPDEYTDLIGDKFFDPRKEEHANSETSTNALKHYLLGKNVYNIRSSVLDYTLLYGDPKELNLETSLIDTYDKNDPYKALSDHKGLNVTIKKE